MAKNTTDNENIIDLFKMSMGESIKEPEPIKHWYDIGNYALNYIFSKRLRAGIPSGRITALEGLSGTGKSLISCNVLRDPSIDLALLIETEGGGSGKELLDYVGVDTKKVQIMKAHTFECYRTNKKNQMIEVVAEKDMPSKLETDQYVYTEGITYLVKKIVDTVRYNPKLCDKKIVIILDSLGNTQSCRSLNGVSDMGARAKEINRFFECFDGVLEKTGISLIFTNKLYTDLNANVMSGKQYVSTGGESVIYNPSITCRFATTAANDDVTDAELKENKEGKTTALGTNLKTLNASIIKSRFATENCRAQFILEKHTGLVKYSGLFKLLKDYGVILQSGSRYTCPCLWGDVSFYKKDFISKFIEDESSNIDKLQKALDDVDEKIRQANINKLTAVDTPMDAEDTEENELDNYVDANDMISAIER